MEQSTIVHIGVKRRSGRYPWGSGGNVAPGTLLGAIDELKSKGFSEKEIAVSLDMTIKDLRNQKSLAKAAEKEAQRLNVIRQRENGMSVSAISKEFNIPASTVSDLLKKDANLKYRQVRHIADILKKLIGKNEKFIDIGEGSEVFMGISQTKLDNAVTLLTNEGYTTHILYQEQLGTRAGKKTKVKVLAAPGVEYSEVTKNKLKIEVPNAPKTDSGLLKIAPDDINNVSSKKVLVEYDSSKDGLIEIRRGLPEASLGNNSYGQVRIGVDGTHYMKGMAVFRDDLPPGVDYIYHTSKKPSANKLSAFKEQQDFGISKFGAAVIPNTYTKNGEEVFGVVNIIGEKTPAVEGYWSGWNKNLASQVLSKQSPALAKKQLEIAYENAAAELSDIMKLTEPTVKNHLLIEFADKTDKMAVDLKASALPRQTTNVILPDPTMKTTEVYAPNYKNGETLSLVRYPHGGIFEIPTLTVNNKQSEYKDIIGKSAQDAIALHPDVAKKLSGADFDGDFVLAIPNKRKELRTAPSLEALKNFEPRTAYPKYDGMEVMSEKRKQRLMGDVSNLITDMTIKGADESEISRAVRHSMVVIDAAKHELNYKQSYDDNGIASLKEKYQGGAKKGAATIVSRSRSPEMVPARHDRYSIDSDTGEKVWAYTEETYTNRKTGQVIPKMVRSTKMMERKDAYDLVDPPGTVIESVYADHANKVKSLANSARKESLKQSPLKYSREAAKTYKNEVESLDRKYKEAIRAKPLERKAQVLGGEIYKSIAKADPGMSYTDRQKKKAEALTLARKRLNAKKTVVDITPAEWTAIETGAVTKTKLAGILKNADMDQVRQHATPRATRSALSTAKKTRALTLQKNGYTNSEIADALGVPVSQIRDIKKD